MRVNILADFNCYGDFGLALARNIDQGNYVIWKYSFCAKEISAAALSGECVDTSTLNVYWGNYFDDYEMAKKFFEEKCKVF